MEAIVISTYCCCGVSYVDEKQEELSLAILDIHKSNFKYKHEYPNNEDIEQFIKDRRDRNVVTILPESYFIDKYKEKKILKRNDKYPNNLINYINEAKEDYDVIFVESDIETRQLLTDNDIQFVTIFPKLDALNSWIGRMYRNNYNDFIIDSRISNWDKTVTSIMEEPHGNFIIRLGSDDFMSDILPDLLQWWKDPENKMKVSLYNRIDK